MGIDKFGRFNRYMHVNFIREPVGEDFHLTDEGDYDIENKRLCNVADAISEEDAVTLRILKENCLCQIDDQFDADLKNIINLAKPELSTDAATKLYVDEKIPIVINGVCNFESHRLSNVGYPLNPTDGANKQCVINAVQSIQKNFEDKFNDVLNILDNHIYSILHIIYTKNTKDNPVKNFEDWKKEYI